MDLISRQAAIDAIHGDADWLASQGSDWQVERMERDKSILQSLPSAQPERKTGEWLMKPDPYAFFDEIPVCSECGHTTKMREKYNFCPNCGADMRGEQDGSD